MKYESNKVVTSQEKEKIKSEFWIFLKTHINIRRKDFNNKVKEIKFFN